MLVGYMPNISGSMIKISWTSTARGGYNPKKEIVNMVEQCPPTPLVQFSVL